MRRALLACLLALAAAGLTAAPAAAAGPPVDRTVGDPRITESSGLAVSPSHGGVLWTHDDSGNPPLLFGLGPSGRTAGTVRITGVPNVDWEAMAAFRDAGGGAVLAVADIGDNEARRSSVEVDLVPEPDRLGTDAEAPRLRLRLRYPDGARDAETLLVDTARHRMFVVSKALLTGTVYAVPQSAWDGALPGTPTTRSATLVPVGTVPLVLVTDGTVAADGTVLLRTYGDLAAFDPFPLDPGTRLLSPRATTALPSQQQGEGLALEPDGRSVLLSSEGTDQPILRFALPPDLRPGAAPPMPSPSRSASDPPASPLQAVASPGPSSPSASAPSPWAREPGFVSTGVLVVLSIGVLAAVAALVALVVPRRSPGNRRL